MRAEWFRCGDRRCAMAVAGGLDLHRGQLTFDYVDTGTGESWDGRRDLARLVVPRCGLLEATGDPFEPYRLVDAHGVVVGPVAVYLRELQACGRPATTQRSYGMDLLRWFRFLWAAGIGWDQATR